MDRNRNTPNKLTNAHVALRKESVDRNLLMYFIIYLLTGSLSARRAWIEIDFAGSAWVSEFRRSPQGERG